MVPSLLNIEAGILHMLQQSLEHPRLTYTLTNAANLLNVRQPLILEGLMCTYSGTEFNMQHLCKGPPCRCCCSFTYLAMQRGLQHLQYCWLTALGRPGHGVESGLVSCAQTQTLRHGIPMRPVDKSNRSVVSAVALLLLEGTHAC